MTKYLHFRLRLINLIESIDQQIIDAAGIVRDEVVMHVHQGRDLGVFSGLKYEDSEDSDPHMA